MAARKVGAERYRALAADNRRVELEAVVMQHPQIVVTVQIIGGKRRGPTAGDERLVEPAQHAVDLADVAIIDRLGRRQGERALHQPHRLVEAVHPERDDPHQMQRRGMIGGFRDNTAQHAVGLGEPARLLVSRRQLHQLRDPLGAGRRRKRRRCHLRRGTALRRDRADRDLGNGRPVARARLNQGDNRDD